MEGWHFILQARTEEKGRQEAKIKVELKLSHRFHNIRNRPTRDRVMIQVKSFSCSKVSSMKIDAMKSWYQIVSRGRW